MPLGESHEARLGPWSASHNKVLSLPGDEPRNSFYEETAAFPVASQDTREVGFQIVSFSPKEPGGEVVLCVPEHAARSAAIPEPRGPHLPDRCQDHVLMGMKCDFPCVILPYDC